MNTNLTERQRDILKYVLEYHSTAGYQPSYRDIAQEFGIRSANGVACHIRAMQRKGVLGKSHGPRAIDLSSLLKVKEEVSKRQWAEEILGIEYKTEVSK